jgi:hypothetical protein
MRKQLGQMLIEADAIDENALRNALADQRRWGRPLGRTLVELRLIREEDLVRVLGQQLGLPSIDLDKVNVPKAVLDLVPASLAYQHNIVPFAQPMKFLDVAMLDPTNLGIVDELRIRTQLNIRPYLAGPKMIERALLKYYGGAIGMSPEYEIPLEVEKPKPPVQAPLQAHRQPRVVGVDHLMPPPVSIGGRDKEIDALQERISKLEALVARDEDVLRKLLALLIEKGLATRDEIVERLG